MRRRFITSRKRRNCFIQAVCVGAAMAIEATMLCANPAVFCETPLKLLPRPMEPHVEIAPGNSEARGHRIGRFFIQIYALQQDSILRRYYRQQPLHARANKPCFLLIRW
jgi:hypothetical protein